MFHMSKNLRPLISRAIRKPTFTQVANRSDDDEGVDPEKFFQIPNRFVEVEEDYLLTVGKYPKTEAERLRAARKYNLIPEDYELHDETDGFGDYPKLKAIGAYNRDQYDDFDDPIDNIFYGEVYHKDADLYGWERIDPLETEKPGYIPYWKRFLFFFCAGTAVPLFYYITTQTNYNINNPWKVRTYHPHQKYYEFPSTTSGGH